MKKWPIDESYTNTFNNRIRKVWKSNQVIKTGLPHTQGTQGIQGIFMLKKISGKLREDHVFYKLILFCRVFTKFQVAFYRFKKFKLFFEI